MTMTAQKCVCGMGWGGVGGRAQHGPTTAPEAPRSGGRWRRPLGDLMKTAKEGERGGGGGGASSTHHSAGVPPDGCTRGGWGGVGGVEVGGVRWGPAAGEAAQYPWLSTQLADGLSRRSHPSSQQSHTPHTWHTTPPPPRTPPPTPPPTSLLAQLPQHLPDNLPHAPHHHCPATHPHGSRHFPPTAHPTTNAATHIAPRPAAAAPPR